MKSFDLKAWGLSLALCSLRLLPIIFLPWEPDEQQSHMVLPRALLPHGLGSAQSSGSPRDPPSGC